jgi:hypothetical protein
LPDATNAPVSLGVLGKSIKRLGNFVGRTRAPVRRKTSAPAPKLEKPFVKSRSKDCSDDRLPRQSLVDREQRQLQARRNPTFVEDIAQVVLYRSSLIYKSHRNVGRSKISNCSISYTAVCRRSLRLSSRDPRPLTPPFLAIPYVSGGLASGLLSSSRRTHLRARSRA